jgi:glycosyltransferase involved in cell wall biosynthesis
MRIAIISDLAGCSWAGCEEMWAALARKALQCGHKVAFYQCREAIDPLKIQPLQHLGLELVPPNIGARVTDALKTRVSWKLGLLAARWQSHFSGIHKFAPDVVFLNAGVALPPIEFIEGLDRDGVLTFPYVLMCHNSYLFENPVERISQQIAARYYQGARRVIFVAERTRKETEHLLVTKLKHATIVRNPINMSDFSPLSMPEGSTVRIASVGRLAMNSKGQDTLLAALGSPSFKDRDWKLSIYGNGPHLKHLQILAEHYQIAERVAFKGYAHDVRAIWAENHLLALPSRNESAPLVLVEAMLCGRPSVVNDVGGIREWISEPETGFISDGIDIDSFQDALERAWSARFEWEVMGRRARDKALQMLDPDPGGTVLNILLEVADNSRFGVSAKS